MRETSAVWRLSFILPENLYRSVPRGPMVPCLFGCLLTVHGAGLVSCEGRPLETVLEQVRRFVSRHKHGPLSIGATLLELGNARSSQSYLITTAGRSVSIEPRAQLQLPGLGDAA
jgi:hypothetical protein